MKSESHRLLILGSLGEFVQLTRKAKERGIYTIVCDGYPDGEARKYADETYVIPVMEVEKIANLCKEKGVDGIITSFSDLLLECMVKIADLAELPCYLKPWQLPWYRDKSATRRLLEEQGLGSPEFAILPLSAVEDPKLLEQNTKHLQFPVVSKPLDKYGSRGIYVSYDRKELQENARITAEFTDLDHILVEEYNDGWEFNMMTWVLDGEVHVISIADREKTAVEKREIPYSSRNVYPSRLYDAVADQAKDILQKFIAKTGQTDGALSMQFFWKPEKGVQVCEIAARFFGYEHELTDIVYGFNMEDLLLHAVYDRTALRNMLADHDPKAPKKHGAVLYFQGRSVTIKEQTSAKAYAKHPAVVKPWIFYQDGETVVLHGPNPYLALYYICADSREELDRITEDFFANVRMMDPEGHPVNYQNQIPEYPGQKKGRI